MRFDVRRLLLLVVAGVFLIGGGILGARLMRGQADTALTAQTQTLPSQASAQPTAAVTTATVTPVSKPLPASSGTDVVVTPPVRGAQDTPSVIVELPLPTPSPKVTTNLSVIQPRQADDAPIILGAFSNAKSGNADLGRTDVMSGFSSEALALNVPGKMGEVQSATQADSPVPSTGCFILLRKIQPGTSR